MTRRIFFKILLTVIALLAVTGVGAAYLLSRTTAANMRADLQRNLSEKARLTGELLEAVGESGYQRVADEIASSIGARVTVVRQDGLVLADSDADPATMENHSDRPELVDALKGVEGVSSRRSDTIGVQLLYLAIPMRGGAVRLALPLSDIDARLGEIRSQILRMLLLALLPAIVIAGWMARRVSAQMSSIIAYSQRLAEGDFQSQMIGAPKGELGLLADTLQTTAGQLRSIFDQLQEERTRFAAAVNGIGEGILVSDRKMRLILFNPAMEQMVPNMKLYRGFSLTDWERKEIPELFLQVLESGEPSTLDLQVHHPVERSWKVSCAPILSRKGKAHAVVAVFYDITELDRVDRMRKDFVINVSHELRTPLAAIQGYAETLLDGALDEPGTNRRFLEILSRNAERLAQLTGDLMTLSQIEVQTREFSFTPHKAAELLEELHNAVELTAQKKAINVQVEPVDPTLTVECDAGAVHQVLNNLLDNAVKYTPEGGSIRVGARDKDDRVEFFVNDTGIGISAEHIPRLFERFYRVDKARSRELGGTGLGLAIVKHLVLAQYGAVRVESEPGVGSTFYFDLHKSIPKGAELPETSQRALF